MDAAANIFVNGLSGVILGMVVLYLAMKIIALIARDRSEPERRD